MLPLSNEQQTKYDATTHYTACGTTFSAKNHTVRRHCHVSGNFLFPACNNCNLQLKTTGRKRKTTSSQNSNDNKKLKLETDEDFFLPVVFHNFKSYDKHFVIKHFKKEYTERKKAEGKPPTYDDVIVTPLNSEKYIMFQIGKLRFLDSFQFMSTSLENLVFLLLKSGREKFVNTTKYLGNDDVVLAKGVYPYSYMTSREKLDESKLPPIEAIYHQLNDEPLKIGDYERAQKTWAHFGMQTLQNYDDHYLLSDVLLLADVFENFRSAIMKEHNLDCLHFVTLPSLHGHRP